MRTLAEIVINATGTSPLECYQCGRCSAGCPQNVPEGMDMGPTRIMRLIQLESAFKGEPDTAANYCQRVLTSDTPWICAGCVSCTQRCPQGIDIAGTMDAVRETCLERNTYSSKKRVRDVVALHKSFINGIKRAGRTGEVPLVAEYKLRTFNLLDDVLLAPGMFLKGKLSLNVFKNQPGMDRVIQAQEKLKEEQK